tara:strand:+ start:1115 stop:1267 length:153 start_codon:yes stop_codon:yes gene_type:complete
MKNMELTIRLYYSGDHPVETKHSNSIEEARRWVAGAEHGIIINDQNIVIE